MLSDIWFPLASFCSIAWMTWLFMSSSRRTQPSLPPGPTGLPVLGMLPFLSPQLHTYFTQLARTYGPLISFRLGRKTIVVVSSPLLAKEILKDSDVTFANHDVTVAGRESSYGGEDTIFLPYGPKWRMLRQVGVNGMLGSAALDSVCNMRRQVINETLLYVQEHVGCPVNIGGQMFVMVLDVITSMLWGKMVKDTKMAREGDEFRRVIARVIELSASPNISDFFPALARFDLQGIEKKMQDCTNRLDQTIEDVIEKRRKMDSTESSETYNVDDNKDFLQYLLQFKDRSDSSTTLTKAQIKALLSGFMVGGTHSTSNTIEFAMTEIVNNPDIMRKVQQELEMVVGAGNQVEESHIHRLSYLQAIMKETLRLHPVFPLLVPHCPSESCVIGGYTIPKGSAVFFNVWAIHRDPSLWEDPLDFKPERFLNGKYDFNGNNFSYFPFGSGRRICSGIRMAEKTIMFTLASLLHNFDWKLPKGVELDISENFAFTLEKATPLMLIPSTR